MKTVCVFGADGRTGRHVLSELKLKGYSVQAFVYHRTADMVDEKERKYFEGDIMNYSHVQKAVEGSDVVITVVGHGDKTHPYMQTIGTKNIIKAMRSCGIRRVISLTGTGVVEKGDVHTFFDTLSKWAVMMFDKKRVVDGVRHAQVLKDSGLDWTIVRVSKLGGEGDLKFRLTEHGPAEVVSHRNRVAHVLVSLIDSQYWIGKSPIMTRR